MSSDPGIIRSISFRDLCPWMILFRSFSLALNPAIVFLASLGLILAMIGWILVGWLFQVDSIAQGANLPGLQQVFVDNASSYQRSMGDPFESGVEVPFAAMSLTSSSGMPGVFWDYASPVKQIFAVRSSALTLGQRLRLFGYFTLGGLWMLAVWSIAAGSITRIAIMRLGREEGFGLKGSVMYALSRFLGYFAGPILPLGAMLGMGLLVGLFSLFMLADWGVFLMGALWLFVVGIGFPIAFLAVGLLFGWPLMWPTISCESSDPFDAISRCYAYVMQRPLHYVGYVAICIIFGAFCSWIVSLFGEMVIYSGNWAASWGAQTEQIEKINSVLDGTATEVSGSLYYGSWMIYFWQGVVRTVAAGYTYGLFWVFASGVYLLLRRDVDETEFDEVFVDGHDDYGLPALTPSVPVPQIVKTPADDQDNSMASQETPTTQKDSSKEQQDSKEHQKPTDSSSKTKEEGESGAENTREK